MILTVAAESVSGSKAGKPSGEDICWRIESQVISQSFIDDQKGRLMKKRITLFLPALCGFLLLGQEASSSPTEKRRIVVASSYHREYLWSQDTNKGVIEALLAFGYLDSRKQGDEYTRNDYVESSRAVIRKLWMDTKRKDSLKHIAEAVKAITEEIELFQPDILLLGDDNAANYVGNQYIDTSIPVVFWGINGLPLKYGLLDSIQKPGHNVTGIYQAGYMRECLIHLKRLLPSVMTFAVLSDDSETGRAKAKELKALAAGGKLPLALVEIVRTNSLLEWRAKALELESKADAFFISNHNTLKDAQDRTIDQLEVGAWYLRKIKKPEVSHERQFVEEGLLAAVDDSGFKQGYEAVRMAHDILEKGMNPAEMPSYAPERGAFIVNRERAGMLGLEDAIKGSSVIEEFIDKAQALHVGMQGGNLK